MTIIKKKSWEGHPTALICHLIKRDKLYRGDELYGYRLDHVKFEGGVRRLEIWFRRDDKLFKVTVPYMAGHALSIRKNTSWFKDGFDYELFFVYQERKISLFNEVVAQELRKRVG